MCLPEQMGARVCLNGRRGKNAQSAARAALPRNKSKSPRLTGGAAHGALVGPQWGRAWITSEAVTFERSLPAWLPYSISTVSPFASAPRGWVMAHHSAAPNFHAICMGRISISRATPGKVFLPRNKNMSGACPGVAHPAYYPLGSTMLVLQHNLI